MAPDIHTYAMMEIITKQNKSPKKSMILKHSKIFREFAQKKSLYVHASIENERNPFFFAARRTNDDVNRIYWHVKIKHSTGGDTETHNEERKRMK